MLILLDDIGFADTSTFGGLAQTPELDRLAANGIRFNNFNNAAMCSPTRAALLTGRNHHRVGFGVIADLSGGYPGYDSVWKSSTASVAEVLRENGYSTAAFGKWHNTPDWEITLSGPFTHWPTGLGFEYFYGFMGPAGQENQWQPSKLYRNTVPTNPPATPRQGYHLTTDLTNDAIRWIQLHEAVAPDKPYFLYFATGAVHAPHQVPKEWIAPYRGKFDRGWDELNREIFERQKRLGVVPKSAQLTARPKEIPSWSSLSPDQRRLYARQMEVYAGFIAHTDHEVGRLLRAARAGVQGSNTLIFYAVGDNGGSAMDGINGETNEIRSVAGQLPYLDDLGSPSIPENNYAAGWAWMGSTPFQWMKTIASHFGGVRDPLIVSWPARIKANSGLRTQFTHVTDVVATIYEVVGIRMPERVGGVRQQPLDGVSFSRMFDNPDAPSNHRVQYFEMLGNRAIYQDGWIAAARHGLPWMASIDPDFSHDRWELYHVSDDFSEAHDLASVYPGKLKALQDVFDKQALANGVYPLDGVATVGKPSPIAGRHQFLYQSGAQSIPQAAAPDMLRSRYRLTADVMIPEGGARGIIMSRGDRSAGMTLYVADGHLLFESYAASNHATIRSKAPVPAGKGTLAMEFDPDSTNSATHDWWSGNTGTVHLYINHVATGEARVTVGLAWGPLGIGRAYGAAVSQAFEPPFEFSGTLERVVVELD